MTVALPRGWRDRLASWRARDRVGLEASLRRSPGGIRRLRIVNALSHGTRATCMGLGALVGIVAACRALDPQFIAGTGGQWSRPGNDFNAYLVAWNYYIIDAWRLPLFSVPAMGYPEGGSVLFNDALPLTALLTKAIYHLAAVRINPFGWWIFLTYVLQGAMAARLACAVAGPRIWTSAAAAVLALVNVSFVWRIGHAALSGHFLVLWALALHFESLRRRRAGLWEMFALLAVALLVNAYLFVMVLVLEAATMLALWSRGNVTTRDVRRSAAGVAAVAVLGALAGYGILIDSPSAMKGEGFGRFSWNLADLLLPPGGVFGFMTDVPRDATSGQYEGEAYIGLGALLLLGLCLACSPQRVLRSVRRYWVLAVTLLALAVYAASNVVYAGGTRVIAYELPQAAIDLGNYLRATGRFIWPLAYALAILPVAGLSRWWPRAPALAAATLGVFLQLQEDAPGFAHRKFLTAHASPELIDAPRFDAWLREHRRLWQYPSWSCGGLTGPRRIWGSHEANRELQLQLVAARAGVPSNSVYTSRALKNCDVEKAWESHPELENGVLYVVGVEALRETGALGALAQSSACVSLDWAVVCSRQWSRAASGGRPKHSADVSLVRSPP